REIGQQDLDSITSKMLELIEKDEPFVKERLLTEDAVEHLMQEGLTEKAQLFEQKGHLYSSLYFLNKLGNYFYGNLLPSTGYISNFDLVKYFDGLLLKVPQPVNFHELQEAPKQKKLF